MAGSSDDADWITARYLLFAGMGRHALVVDDYVDEEDFPISRCCPPPAAAPPPRRKPAAIRTPAGPTVCAVCTEEISEAEREVATWLPCAHGYHAACIAPWLAIRNTCPMCRQELTVEGFVSDCGEGRTRPTPTATVSSH